MSRAFMHGEMKPKSLDPDRLRLFVMRLGLSLCQDSAFIWRGDCPLCGGVKTFTLWQKYAQALCGACGLDARFGPAPEAQLRKGGV